MFTKKNFSSIKCYKNTGFLSSSLEMPRKADFEIDG